MENAATVVLPGGLWLDGVHHREACLRPLTGDDEVFLAESEGSLLPAGRITALLARCLTRLGPLDTVSTETARSLTVGDREALLLHLRRLTLGERLQCVLTCPQAGCGEKMDLELAVNDLLLAPYSHTAEHHETTVSTENGDTYRVRFRPPTGADQEEAASVALGDPHAAVDLLLHRCVESVVDEDDVNEPIPVKDWPEAIARQLPPVMAELDPQAELRLSLTCPVCGHAFSAIFDTADYFFQEIAGRAKHLYRQVHTLAFYYHWSEAEIIGMTSKKRHIYLDLLSEALSGEESG